MNLEASERGDGCFRVLSGSHLLHEAAPWVGTPKDWYKLSESDVAWYKGRGCVDRLISAPKGSIVLWDSRAIHANTKPAKGRESARFRYTAFVCMQPRSHVYQKVGRKRKAAFLNDRTTSHWPGLIS